MVIRVTLHLYKYYYSKATMFALYLIFSENITTFTQSYAIRFKNVRNAVLDKNLNLSQAGPGCVGSFFPTKVSIIGDIRRVWGMLPRKRLELSQDSTQFSDGRKIKWLVTIRTFLCGCRREVRNTVRTLTR